MRNIQTIKNEVELEGVGIHSGKYIKLRMKPYFGEEIVFSRTDQDNFILRIDPSKIVTQNSAVLKVGNQKIRTIEHLMAVLHIFEIDSLLIELDGEEIPILDGSAAPFVDALYEARVTTLPGFKRSVRVLKDFTVEENDSLVTISPCDKFKISYWIEYEHPLIQEQKLSFFVNRDNFISMIAEARTFGFLDDVPGLRERNLALGGSLENAIILNDTEVINGPLRFPDEFVRHKILDLIGDLSLFGYPLLGHFKAKKAGHKLHLKTVRFLIENPDYWTFV